MHSSKEYTMGYFYTDASLFHADKRDKGMNSTTSEKGTDNKRNNSSAYNHEYYMKNKEKWQDNKKSNEAKDNDTVKELSDMSGMKEEECQKLLQLAKTKGYDSPEYKELLDSLSEGDPEQYKRMEAVVKKNVGSSDSGEKEFDVDAAAMDVIRGKYGNGAERKAALGEDYAEVQKRVNELMKAQNDGKKQMSKTSVEPKLTTIGKVDKKYVRHMEVDMTNNDWRIYQGDLDYLAHHGIRGQKWGVRRFENANGTLTAAGKARYDDGKVSAKEKNAFSAKATAYKALGGMHKFNAALHPGKKGKALAEAAGRVADREAAKAQAQANAKKAAYKENLRKVNDASDLKDKLIYNEATRKKAAKLMTKNKNMTLEQARKEANSQAWKNTAAILAVSGILSYTAMKDMGY